MNNPDVQSRTERLAVIAYRVFVALTVLAIALTLFIREEQDRTAAQKARQANYQACVARDASVASAVKRERAIAELQSSSKDPTRRAEAPIHTQSADALTTQTINCLKVFGGPRG